MGGHVKFKFAVVCFARAGNYFLPVGPARAIQAPMPFQIVQSKGTVALLVEYQHSFRLIYTDGRGHPEDLDPFGWFGGSIGR
jgi:hypothetical protein